MLSNKTFLITGGTGSFGSHVVKKILEEYSPKSIIVFSRDEKKQFDMRIRFKNPNLKFIIGDVRDRDSVSLAMKGVDYVFHAAAFKQVPTCEFFPLEAIKTNVIGTSNVLEVAEEYNVKKVVVLSTDKAVYPINAMGMTKALLEKLMLAKTRDSHSNTTFCGVRYGNVMYSRGSVIPLFIDQIKRNQKITVTTPEMTRFLLTIPTAIDLVLYALKNGENGDIFVRKAPASTIGNIAKAVLDIFKSSVGIRTIGIREGEKMHETLVTQEELMKAKDLGQYYCIQNLKRIDYDKYFVEGHENHFPKEGFTSENTKQLSFEEVKNLLISLDEIKELLK